MSRKRKIKRNEMNGTLRHSPKIGTSAFASSKMMEAVAMSQQYASVINFRNEFSEFIAATTKTVVNLYLSCDF
ncbi:unnamed protein product [Lupinus luteus]|uniref:Uncharacterized protein n=1 Tax=Lupinus luteus TaxID=3873 RepID=A0AAV1Y5V1_LUPLU